MNMQSDGAMDSCPFTLGSSVCNMTPLEHVGAFQTLFTSTATQYTHFLLLILASAAFLIPVFVKANGPPKLHHARRPIHNRRDTPFSNPLQELYSSGILNPKTF